MEKDKNTQVWYKSPWLIGWLTLVLTVVMVNAYMIMQSMTNFPGLVVDDFYERGQNYEENIVTKLEANEHWITEFKVQDIHVNQAAIIDFSIKDKQGNPATIEKITLFAYRPSNAKKDFSVPMKVNSSQQESYQAEISFSLKGQWDLLASVVIDGTEVNYAKKIFVKD